MSDKFDKSIDNLEESQSIDQNNEILGTINERARRLNGLYKTQQTIYLNYVSGIDSDHRNSYSIVHDEIINEVTNIDNDLKSIESDINIIEGTSAKDDITEFDGNLNDRINNILDTLSYSTINNVSHQVFAFKQVLDQKMSYLSSWIFLEKDGAEFLGFKDDFLAETIYIDNINNSIIDIQPINNSLYQGHLRQLDSINSNYTDFLLAIDTVEGIMQFATNEIDTATFQLLNTQYRILRDRTNSINIDLDNMIESLTFEKSKMDIWITFAALDQNTVNNALIQLISWSNSVKLELQQQSIDLKDQSSILQSEFNEIANLEIIILSIILWISIFFIISIIILVHYQISKPIKLISFWSEKIAEGDLTRRRNEMRREDEIGVLHNNFRNMSDNLIEIITDIKGASYVISDTADNLSSNTEEINATAEEVSAIAQSMAKGSTHQAELIATIVEELQITSEIVDNVINQINYNLRIIHDLSEQTNILALNTAIEAANAGDFGKGFTVISESIRKMSAQSKQTTEEVTRDSRGILSQLQDTFSNITRKIENVAAVSEETAASAEEVAASAEEMTATMQNVSATSHLLNEKAHQFEESVKDFKLESDIHDNEPLDKTDLSGKHYRKFD